MVSTAVTRLAVYRRSQVFVIFGRFFKEKLDFSRINIYFLDFDGLKHVSAKAHARGFAPL